MREILFKGKRKNNGEWIEGYLFDNGFDGEEKKYFIGGLIIEKYNGTACDEWDITGIDFCEIDPETLCQFTGRCDKNENKIWENDIIQYGAVAAVVKFGEYGNGNLGFYVDFPEETNYRKDFSYWAKKVVVIGNAIDDRSLLQEVLE
jgi:uncharacterized phage protein (TIGR01671 family)